MSYLAKKINLLDFYKEVLNVQKFTYRVVSVVNQDRNASCHIHMNQVHENTDLYTS